MPSPIAEWWTDISVRTSPYPLECLVLAICILLSGVLSFKWKAVEQGLTLLANRRLTALLVIFVIALGGHWFFEVDYIVPAPGVHDEFSHLLAADTFANGRVTNPPHPMGYFLESFHILLTPTYMSMYPPGQGLALAAGIILGGDAIVGVWLSAALLCVAILWMLQGWVPPRWALIGALLCVVRIGWFSYWANSYWGGCVAAIGSALLLGAVGRLRTRASALLGVVAGVGVLALLNTRPYEGSITAAVVFLWMLLRGHLRRTPMVAAFTVIVIGASAMFWYNWRITNNPLRMPFLENRAQYEIHPTFVWQPAGLPKTYSHEVMRQFYSESEGYLQHQGYARIQVEKGLRIWIFFIGPALTIPLFAVRGFKNDSTQLAALIVTALLCAHALVTWHLQAHYAAPATAAIYLLLIAGLRHLRLLRFRQIDFARACLMAVLVMALIRSSAPALGVPIFREATQPWYSYGEYANFSRRNIERKLVQIGGRHLVLVRYSPGHPTHVEWVYNRASIDDASVVWARYVDEPDKLTTLLTYFTGRRVWLVSPDEKPNELNEYKESR